MRGAQRGSSAAPLASALAEGFTFRSTSLRRAFEAFREAERRSDIPVILTGPQGIGKKSILAAYLRERAGDDALTYSLSASALRTGEVATQVLAGFGLQPIEGAEPETALYDFLQDCAETGQSALVAIADLQKAEHAAVSELASLARPPERGGVGLLVFATSTEPRDAELFGTAALPVRPLGADEIIALGTQLFRLENRDEAISDEAAAALAERTGGHWSDLVPLFDEAVARMREQQALTLAPSHVEGEPPRAGGFSPDDIEAALLALGDPPVIEEDPDDMIRREFEALRHEPARPPREERPRDFPRISAGPVELPTTGPANDPVRPLDPRVVSALEELAAELSALRHSVDGVREETGRLREAASRRRDAVGEATGRFVADLHKPLAPAAGE